MKHGEVTFGILEAIGATLVDMSDLMQAILKSRYGASSGEIQFAQRRVYEERLVRKEQERIKQNYHNLISSLKTSGLIETKEKEGKRLFMLTLKGRKKLYDLKTVLKIRKPTVYATQPADNWIIVVFDIPERERKKRDWLRRTLRNLGFKILQKSVWLGRKKLPQEFLDDLFDLELTDFVEIFEISKTGSLKHLL